MAECEFYSVTFQFNGHWCVSGERQLCPVDSTDRCNTLLKFLCWGLILQGLSRALVKLARNGAEFGLGFVTLTQMNQIGRLDPRLGCHNFTPFNECCGAGLTKSSARD
jgi:hypothetical protein